jgi:hypothetical protein
MSGEGRHRHRPAPAAGRRRWRSPVAAGVCQARLRAERALALSALAGEARQGSTSPETNRMQRVPTAARCAGAGRVAPGVHAPPACLARSRRCAWRAAPGSHRRRLRGRALDAAPGSIGLTTEAAPQVRRRHLHVGFDAPPTGMTCLNRRWTTSNSTRRRAAGPLRRPAPACSWRGTGRAVPVPHPQHAVSPREIVNNTQIRDPPHTEGALPARCVITGWSLRTSVPDRPRG